MPYDIPFRSRSRVLRSKLTEKKYKPFESPEDTPEPTYQLVPTSPPEISMPSLGIQTGERLGGIRGLAQTRVYDPAPTPVTTPTGVPTAEPEATTEPTKYELDPMSRRLREIEEFEEGAEDRAARIQEESQIYPDQPEEGSWFYNRGVTEPPGSRVPLDFTTGEGFLGEATGIGLGSLYVAGQFMEPIQQPLDVATETAIESIAMIGGGPKPTIFTAGTEDKPGGYSGALEKFRDRSWYVQLLSSLPTEVATGTIIGKTVKLATGATGVMNLPGRSAIINGAADIDIVPTARSSRVSGSLLDNSAIDLVKRKIDESAPICFSECINPIGDNVLKLREVKPGLSRQDASDNIIRKLFRATTHDVQGVPIIRHAIERKKALESMAQTMGLTVSHVIRDAFPDINDQELIPSLSGIDMSLSKDLNYMPSVSDVAARLDIFAPHLTEKQMTALQAVRKKLAPWRELLDMLGIPLGSRRDVTGIGFYIPRGDAIEIGAEQIVREKAALSAGGGKQGFEMAESFPSMSSGVGSGHKYANIQDTITSYINHAGERSIDVHTGNLFKKLQSENGELLVETPKVRLERNFPSLKKTVINLRSNIRNAGQSIRSQDAVVRRVTREKEIAEGEVAAVGERLAGARGRLDELQPEFLSSDRKLAVKLLDEAKENRDMLHEEVKSLGAQIRSVTKKLDDVEAGWVAAALSQAKDLAFAQDYTRFIDNTLTSPVEGYFKLIDKIADMNGYIDELLVLRDNLANKVDELIEQKALKTELSDDARANVIQQGRNVRATQHRMLSVRATETQIRLMEMEERRALRRDLRLGKDIGKRKERLEAIAAKKAKMEEALAEKNEAWRHAIESSRRPRDRHAIDYPGLQGNDFPSAMANSINKIIASEKKAMFGDSWILNSLKDFNGLYLGLKAGYDDSIIFIQGLPGFFGTRGKFGGPLRAITPTALSKEYASLLSLNLRSWADPNVLSAFVFGFDEAAGRAGRFVSEEWASYGLRVGGVNTEFRLGGGGGIFRGVERIPGVQASNRAFGFFGDGKRLQFADDMLEEEISKGRSLQDIIDSGDAARIAEISNNMTGWSRHRVAGSLGDLMLLAPRYFSSRIETSFKTAMGMIPIVTKKGLRWGPRLDHRMARRTMIRTIVSSMAITYGANKLQGKETDFRPIVNGRWNPQFNRIHAFGRDISLLGPWDSLARLTVALGTDQFDAIRGMMSGSGTVAWDFLSGSDFRGERTRDSHEDVARTLFSYLMPFSAEEGAEATLQTVQHGFDGDWKAAGSSGAGVAMEVFGVKSSVESLSDMKQNLAVEYMEKLKVEDPAKYKRVMDNMNMTSYDRMSGQDYLYDHLTDEIKNEILNDESIKAATEELPDRLPDMDDQIAVALNLYREAKQASITQLATVIATGRDGAELRSAVQTYKTQVYNTSNTVFSGGIGENMGDKEKKNTIDILRDAYWAVELPEDPETGILDYDTQAAEREEIIATALDKGLEERDITVRMQTGNPSVDAVLNQYHSDMETLKPLWEMEDMILGFYSSADREVWNHYLTLDSAGKRLFARQNEVIGEIQDDISDARYQKREDNPDIDVAYIRQGYRGNPATLDGAVEFDRIAQPNIQP